MLPEACGALGKARSCTRPDYAQGLALPLANMQYRQTGPAVERGPMGATAPPAGIGWWYRLFFKTRGQPGPLTCGGYPSSIFSCVSQRQ